jgi:hypothetical protein
MNAKITKTINAYQEVCLFCIKDGCGNCIVKKAINKLTTILEKGGK